jgi:ParB-like chromosome segregation protein Spo0J
MKPKRDESEAAGEGVTNLAGIHEGLRQLARPIADVVPDPTNARLHDRANLDAIKGSLRQFGQRTPLVVQQQGMIVRKGNGTLAAARELGWTHLAMLVVDEDNVSATCYAIADNRSSELGSWDDDVLRKAIDGIDTGDRLVLRTLDQLIDEISAETAEGDDDGGERSEPEPPEGFEDQWAVVVNCRDEDEQRDVFERMKAEGRNCRLLTV